MAVSFEALRSRIAIAKASLSKAGPECLRVASSTAQAKALLDMVSRCTLSTDEEPTVIEDLSQCAFQESDLAEILSKIQKCDDKPTKISKKDSKLGQDYLAMHVYMKEELQDLILDPEVDINEKEKTLVCCLKRHWIAARRRTHLPEAE